ncbi:IucA/IucC family C-terminal-domain containing protein [Streptomyces huiliensis]|uniref:IucA/IucC family C-terminal-domain containing protein n=1 Tax=Streptomyces huiliensis TaxID=2876027 RepID=UPI001CC09913|nr:IucA/IucC family C-terminal-domain containing protein [Streptomyces huiliensis]MBZ4322412.1 IucA/IucC family siderophore biosynthesis protein [Streptomyces huiliensis]
MNAGDVESGLVARVLDALLREDVCRLRGTARAVSRPDGERLALSVAGETILLPVAYDGPGGAARVRAALLETADGVVTGLDAVLARLRPAADPRECAGFDAFTAACAAELAALRLRERTHTEVTERLAAAYGRSTAEWTGPRGALAYDVLAARRPDPDPPAGRPALAEPLAHAPEFHPCFGLRWIALPHAAVRRGPEEPPEWWPAPADLGLPELSATHTALPVHPLSVGAPLARALRAAGLDGTARLAEKPWADVVPTRSAGTLALADAPETRLELPLPAAAPAGPAALADGVVTERLLEEILLCEPGFVGSVLLADADTYLHAGHPLLTARVRRDPRAPDDAHVVPVAALAARTPDGEPVARALARRYYGGSARAFADAYLTLLLDWCTTLFSYGVALETHPRDLAVVLDEHRGRTRLRLLYRDHAGPRVNGVRLASRLGGEAADLLGFTDRGILAGHDGPVADLLAAGALRRCAVEPLAALTGPARAHGLRLLRDRLDDALDRIPPGAATVLRTRLLDAGRLPVHAVLAPALRPGAPEYVNVPNYLTVPVG